MITSSRSGYDTQINFSSEELHLISQDISNRFAPSATAHDAAVTTLRPPFCAPAPLAPSKTGKKPPHYASRHTKTKLSAAELLAISHSVTDHFAPQMPSAVSELMLLPVDPHHLYAYWNIDKNLAPPAPQATPDDPWVLRIYWRPDGSTDLDNSKIWFDIALHDLQSRQKIRLPIDNTAYSAVIGQLTTDNNLSAYAESNIVYVPSSQSTSMTDNTTKIQPKTDAAMPSLPMQSPYLSPFDKGTEVIEIEAKPTGLLPSKPLNEPALHRANNQSLEQWFFANLIKMLIDGTQNPNQQIMIKISAFASSYSYRHEKTASGLGL